MNSLAPSASHCTAAPQSAISHPPSTIGGPAASAISHQSSVLGRFAAFTLIELLVVISIIAILAALAFPAVNGALDSARKAEARNDVNQIANALRNFKLEYKRLPAEGTEIAVLRGENVDGQNPKQLVFMEMKNARGNPPKKGYQDGQFYDPWGLAYVVVLDGGTQDSDGRINSKITRNGTEYITQVIVESEGGLPSQQNRKPINNVQ
jgi:type II secretion system protein G